MNITDRFWSKVDTSGDCWVWTAVKVRGYGQFTVNRVKFYAHRFAWEMEHGAIPPGLVIDHLCRTTACVRVSHLEPVTTRENVRRGMAFKGDPDYCWRGHPWNEANSYDGGVKGRQCRACRRISDAQYRDRVRQAAARVQSP